MDDKAPRKPHWGVGEGKREGCGEVPPSGDVGVGLRAAQPWGG